MDSPPKFFISGAVQVFDHRGRDMGVNRVTGFDDQGHVITDYGSVWRFDPVTGVDRDGYKIVPLTIKERQYTCCDDDQFIHMMLHIIQLMNELHACQILNPALAERCAKYSELHS